MGWTVLTPADAEVVFRDPDLAALALLLDSTALEGWLSERTGVACTVRPLRLRYKRGTSCVLSFELTSITGSTLCVAKAYTTNAAAKMAKSVRRAPVGAVVTNDSSAHLLVTTIAADRDLPALAALHDEDARHRVLRAVLPELRHTPVSLRTLRYNPERRWVGLVDTGERALLLRSYRADGVSTHAKAYAALEGQGPATPRLLGRSRRYGTAAVEWVPGRELAAAAAPDEFAAAGAALAELHHSPAAPVEANGPRAQARSVRAAARQVGVLLPDLAPDAARLAEHVAARIQRLGQVRAVLHGDFSADQVVIGPDGQVTLIDLDSAGIGDPAIDLGCAAAGLADRADGDSTRLVDALHAGYAGVRPLPSAERLAVHGAAHLLRRAGEAFRRRDEDWPEQMRHLLDRADAELAGTRGPGARR